MIIRLICAATVFLLVATGTSCFEGGGDGGGSSTTGLEPVGSLRIDGPSRIKNGETGTYTLTVTRPNTASAATGNVTINGSGIVLDNPAVTFAAGAGTATTTFSLNCTPAGREGKLAGPRGNTGHGSRICKTVGPIVVCNDDPVGVTANFPQAVESNPIDIVCKPSEGPDEGSTPPPPPRPKI